MSSPGGLGNDPIAENNCHRSLLRCRIHSPTLEGVWCFRLSARASSRNTSLRKTGSDFIRSTFDYFGPP